MENIYNLQISEEQKNFLLNLLINHFNTSKSISTIEHLLKLLIKTTNDNNQRKTIVKNSKVELKLNSLNKSYNYE